MAETLKAEVKSVVYHNPANGYTVARVRARNEAGDVTVVGVMAQVCPGEMLDLTGRWVDHPKFGRQFEVHVAQQAMPATINGIRRYLSSGNVRGIGPKLAARLVDHFGAAVLDVLDQEPERLLEVEGLGRKKLAAIRESWAGQHEARNLMIFLQSHQVSPTHAARIWQRYGSGAEAKLRENPYELAYEIRGVGFRTADGMALRLGFSPDAPQRVEAGVVYALFSASEKGHLFLPEDELVRHVLGLLAGWERVLAAPGGEGGPGAEPGAGGEPQDQDGPPPWLLEDDPGLADAGAGPGPEAVRAAVAALEHRKRVVVEELPAQGVPRAVFLMHFYRHETETATRLYHLIEHPTPLDLAAIRRVMPGVEAAAQVELSAEQRAAVLAGCENKVFVITGGPGTGKTTITRTLVSVLTALKFKVKLAAPTGRAAKRLAEATDHPASTLHRLLQYSPEGGFQLGEDNKIEAAAVVVDEASMLDESLFLALLRALPLTCRLVLIGDVNQLPSVGPGNILGDILASQAVPHAVLTRIFRQARESLIVTNAHRVNAGQLPENNEPPGPADDFFWVRRADPADICDYILELATQRIPRAYGLDPRRDIQVLTPIHKGPLGTQALNRLLQERLNPRGREIRRGETIFRQGDRVLQLRNNYDKDVFNGDLGWIAAADPAEGELLVEFDGREVAYEAHELDELAPAYAVSVHKSQGSEYPAVIMPVVPQHYIMLERNLIYTGLTRARRLAVLIGPARAMAIGLGRANSRKRNTNLQYRLQAAFNH